MGKRVSDAKHLGVLLTEAAAEAAGDTRSSTGRSPQARRQPQGLTHEQLTLGANARGPPSPTTDLQHDYVDIRKVFMKEILKHHPQRLIGL